MNESMGNAMIFYGIIIFVILFIAFFIGSVSYSKAYKVKNRIIEEIEKQGEYLLEHDGDVSAAYNDTVQGKIYDWLKGGSSSTGTASADAKSWGDVKKSNQNTTINATGIGYQKNFSFGKDLSVCNKYANGGTLVNKNGDYVYCVFRHDTRDGCYYSVVTFMSFNVASSFGLNGLSITIPVKGETMTFRKIEN